MASGRPSGTKSSDIVSRKAGILADSTFGTQIARDELHVAARIDNFRHIARAYGNGTATAVFEEVCQTFCDLVSINYFGSGIVLPGEDGAFSLILRSAADTPATGPDSLLARFAIVWSVIGSSSFEHGDARIHVALAATSARSPAPASAADRDTRLLAEARETLARLPLQGAPPEPGHGWLRKYRNDMAAAAGFFAAAEADGLLVAWQAVRGTRAPDGILYHETLLRCLAADGDAALPGETIALLEGLGLICALDRLMVFRVIEELVESPRVCLGVNISAQSARLDPWWEGVTHCLAAYGRLGTRLFIEITETLPMLSKADALEFASSLRGVGCKLVIDDFGVGHASFWSLLGLAPDVVKIDGGFLRRAAGCERNRVILYHIVGLARALAPAVVIEGVETADLAEAALASGADWQQGYFLGRPSIVRSWKRYPANDDTVRAAPPRRLAGATPDAAGSARKARR